MKSYKPVNPNATDEVRSVLKYLSKSAGDMVITGQHTQTMVQKELRYIQDVTGKLPALCGFELLAYSPNINYEASDAVCLLEVEENKNTLDKAYEWAEKGGLITFSWHWFSPIGGKGKAFYTEHTDFDARKVLDKSTDEYQAFISDMDVMADLLKPFQEKKIPILWRPFHESEGTWFWWGAHGPKVARDLYLLMYDHFTNKHQLNNLIWVWNCPLAEGYVGDDFCDVISVDLYPPEHQHQDFKKDYDNLMSFASADKLASLAEIGILPDLDAIGASKLPWSWFMIWSNEFCLTDQYSTKDMLKRVYESPYAITLDKLPKLF